MYEKFDKLMDLLIAKDLINTNYAIVGKENIFIDAECTGRVVFFNINAPWQDLFIFDIWDELSDNFKSEIIYHLDLF